MTDEEKKICCVGRRDVYRALLSVATSFIGALLALAVFAAIHKPPKIHGQFPPPVPAQESIHRGGPGMMPHGNHLRDERRGDVKDRKGPGGEMTPPPAPPQKFEQPQKQAAQGPETPKAPQTPEKK